MADIVISYARRDRAWVERLAKALKLEGWSLWWDQVIPPGRDFYQVIEEEIKAARCVVVVWSTVAVVSRWVRDEAAAGRDANKLVPVFREDVAVPMGFRTIQGAVLTSWDGDRSEEAFRLLVEGIRRIVDGPALEPPLPPASTVPTPHAGGSVATKPVPARRALPGERIQALTAPSGCPNTHTDLQSSRTDVVREDMSAPPRSTSAEEKPGPTEGGQTTWRYEPLSVFRDRLQDGSEGPKMLVVPAGVFRMGSPEDEAGRSSTEGPVHTVTFASSFAIGKHPVTFEEYDRFAEATGSKKPSDNGWGRWFCPVILVSWNDAQAYCRWLWKQTGNLYRLPTEAEWEYAARAGTTTAYWWGNDPDAADAHAWYSNNSGTRFKYFGKRSRMVGFKPPNPWGLEDVAGNVYEWVQDCWHDSYHVGVPSDGSAWTTVGRSDLRVMRGGAWYSECKLLRSASREWFPKRNGNFGLGFRLAMSL